MFVLICATLLFSVRRITAATGGSTTWCFKDYCITVSEGKIAAEAGLCVVIPCSFTTAPTFTPTHLVWYKCGPSNEPCVDSNMIFHSNKSSKDVQAGFMGRVSLLELYNGPNNCSIIINDLTESDSGSYRLRVKGAIDGKENGVTFKQKVNISVKGLTQKPTVGIPPLTEGQQTTLSCTAPALCSGSDPEITWTWRGAGEKDSPITGSITAVKTENLTSVTRRRSSTLTFNPSAEHHGTNVTCKVSFTNNITTEETVTLNVTYVKDFHISRNTSVKEGEPLNLTCGVESFPPSLIMWTRSPETHRQNETDANWQNNTETFMQRESGMSTFYVFNVTPEYSGRYICTAKHLNHTQMDYVDVNVIYMRSPVITGSTTAMEGGALNLTCAVESFPPSLITWTRSPETHTQNETDTNWQNNTETFMQRERGMSTFYVFNVTPEYSGRYICTAKHLNHTLVEYVDVNVIYMRSPVITGSTTAVEGGALNLTCAVESFPPSLITWTRSPETNTQQNETDTNWQNNTETFMQRESGMSTFYVFNVTPEYSGRYICTAKHLNHTLVEYVDVNVIYMRSPVITGSTTAVEGGALNLTCAVESFPPSRITWAASGTTRQRGLDTDPHNGTGSAASLVIPDVAAEDSGRYTCTAQHLDRTVTTYADVTVTWPPRFLNCSRCEVRSEVVTCVCVSEGLPLPSITWPLLKNHSEYSVVTNVSGHTVNSTATLTLRDHVGTSIECVSSNDHGEAREDLKVQQNTWVKGDQSSEPVPWLQVVVAFFFGVLLSAVLCCLVTRRRRRKQKISTKQDETHEMVTSQDAPLINGAQAVEDDQTYYQESAEGERGAAPDLDGEPKDVLYASIDFSLLSRKNLSGAARSREATETEYAEIKEVAEEEMENSDGEGVNASGGSMLGEDGEDEVAVYSSVKDVMSEI